MYIYLCFERSLNKKNRLKSMKYDFIMILNNSLIAQMILCFHRFTIDILGPLNLEPKL